MFQPSLGSGLTSTPTKPSSLTQRSSSSSQSLGSVPLTWGSAPTPRKRSGRLSHTRWMTSFTARFQYLTMMSGFCECIIWNGRGEMNCTSVPTLS